MAVVLLFGLITLAFNVPTPANALATTTEVRNIEVI